eukprot:TRINITY_DN8289_c0_g1_i2.p1 TRINITY_DN8289_c0_g1~~TRINITY_DN8289_c0_g1_i2.p1  ORF type:complete len:141 (+),score=31.66 TRINITY_DN8289_c0_g1_i2:420-842(+)
MAMRKHQQQHQQHQQQQWGQKGAAQPVPQRQQQYGAATTFNRGPAANSFVRPAASPAHNAPMNRGAASPAVGQHQRSWGAGNAGSAADRSRTPAARQPPPAPGKKPLPHPWEEHFSEEYNIPYFWNSETGDALWEKPSDW